MDKRVRQVTVHEVAKSWTRLRDKAHIMKYYSAIKMKKEMATPSSILVWKIPWMDLPVRLKFIGLQRVGHN